MLNEIAAFFRDLRRVTGKSTGEIAAHLQTDQTVVLALELGRVDLLPNWPETVRVVREYTDMVGLDPRPSLAVLELALAERDGPLSPQTFSEASSVELKIPSPTVAELYLSARPPSHKTEPSAPSHILATQHVGPALSESLASPAPDVPVRAPAQTKAPTAPAQRSMAHGSDGLPVGRALALVPQPDARDDGSDAASCAPAWRKGRSGMPVPAPASGVRLEADEDGENSARPEGLIEAVRSVLSPHIEMRLPSRRLIITAVLAVAAPFAAAVALAQPVVVTAASAALPSTAASIVRDVHQFLVVNFAPERDGYRWVEVEDPRSRRADKLPAQ